MKVYVGCAIQNLSQAEWDLIRVKVNELKEKLTQLGCEVLNFRSDQNRQAEPGSVFRWDYNQCMACDAMIAVALHPSTGMGMEIIICLMKPKSAFVFATAPSGNNTSRMVTDCDLPGYKYEEFDNWAEIPDRFFRAWNARKHNKRRVLPTKTDIVLAST